MKLYRWIFSYSSKYWLSCLVAVLSMIVDAGSAAGFANLVKPMIDDTLSPSPSASAWHVALMIVGVLTMRSVAGYLGDTKMSYVGRMTVRDMRDDVFAAQLAASEFDGVPGSVGERVANIAYAVEQVAFSVTDAARVIVLDGFTSVFCVGLMLYLSPPLAFTMAAVIPLMAFVAVHSARYVKRLSIRYQQYVSEANTAVVEAWSNARYIKVFGAFASIRNQFTSCSSQIADVGMRLSQVSSAASAATQLAGGISLALVILVSSGSLFSGVGPVSPGTFFAVITAMGIAVPSMRRLSGVYSGIQRALVSAEVLRKTMRVKMSESPPPERPSPRGMDVEFVDVGVTYGDRVEALANVSLKCHAGLTLIVGESGSGKSSLLALLPGFRIPSVGSVFVDGVALSSYPEESIYRAIAWVGSTEGVMSGTVRENIAFGELGDSRTEDIVLAARSACAWDFIDQLPDGLETRLGAGGHDLSEGQKQRLLIARAMLKRASIVLLDEATSALDRATERAVGRGILDVFHGCTVLMATHRLDLAERADQIVVMEHGRVVEVGKHRELLDRHSAYWRLVSRCPRPDEEALDSFTDRHAAHRLPADA